METVVALGRVEGLLTSLTVFSARGNNVPNAAAARQEQLMSLHVFVDDPAPSQAELERHFLRPAGIERARQTLWGTQPIARRSSMLAQIEHDLHVTPDSFSEFERQCRVVFDQADQIATELKGRRTDGAYLREYVQTFLDAIAFAREHNSPLISIM